MKTVKLKCGCTGYMLGPFFNVESQCNTDYLNNFRGSLSEVLEETKEFLRFKSKSTGKVYRVDKATRKMVEE